MYFIGADKNRVIGRDNAIKMAGCNSNLSISLTNRNAQGFNKPGEREAVVFY